MKIHNVTYEVGDILKTANTEDGVARYRVSKIDVCNKRIYLDYYSHYDKAWMDNGHYSLESLYKYCVHVHSEVEYDPSQQGDTDDDI